MPVGRHATPTLPLLDLIYARQLTLHGTRGLGAHRFSALFEMIRAGRLVPEKLITRHITLSQTEAVLREMDSVQSHGVTVINKLQS